VAVLAALGILAGAAAFVPAQTPPPASLAGQLLVASPDLSDPRFARTVVYIIRHDASGALGFVVNRPLGDMPLRALMERMGLPGAGVDGAVRMQAGGPVGSSGVFALHTGEWTGPGTQAVQGGFAVTTQPEILQALARSEGPRRVIFLLGYAGWAPGQLEAEYGNGTWLRAPADEALVFGPDHDTKWERARSRQRIDL
jgi:putative transcriptional regulator